MITVVKGRPGEGKSVFLVSEILKWSGRGFEVYSNVFVKFPPSDRRAKFYHYTTNPIEVLVSLRLNDDQKGIKFILDEVQTYLNSRKWDSLPDQVQYFLQQHRKRGIDIIGATQSVKRADVVFRELIGVFYGIRRIFAFRIKKLSIGLFLLSEYDPDSIESSTRTYEAIGFFPWPVFIDPFTFSIYDTTQEYAQTPVGKREIREYELVKKEVVESRLISTKVLQ